MRNLISLKRRGRSHKLIQVLYVNRKILLAMPVWGHALAKDQINYQSRSIDKAVLAKVFYPVPLAEVIKIYSNLS